jgi:hypothetical protein
MRVAKQHLDDGTIQGDGFIFEIGRTVRVVGVSVGHE